MDQDLKQILFWAAILVTLLFAVVAAINAVNAKQSSDAFNRLTGAHTTWWDAYWIELKVVGKPEQ